VLRTYSDRGRPFAVWFLILARNKILDHLRAKGNIPGDPIEEGSGGIGAKLADTKPAPDQTIDVLRVLTVVREVLAALGDVCRILIEGAAEGYRPRELVQLLGWKAEDNKKVSDSLRYCRTKLRAALRERGVGEDELRTVLGE
jgi:DNA-directed RNA polymerase specialized sigma24 family protein